VATIDSMKHDVAEILKQALALATEDRAALAEALLASLHDDDVERTWAAEIECRVAELDAGTVSAISGPNVRRRLFERARRRALQRLHDGLDLQWVPSESRGDLHRR
jgi:putative addiction module component (TIGR02574 family)